MIDKNVARNIRLVVLDVDGVLTDGGIYLGASEGKPLEFKRYDIQDGKPRILETVPKEKTIFPPACKFAST